MGEHSVGLRPKWAARPNPSPDLLALANSRRRQHRAQDDGASRRLTWWPAFSATDARLPAPLPSRHAFRHVTCVPWASWFPWRPALPSWPSAFPWPGRDASAPAGPRRWASAARPAPCACPAPPSAAGVPRPGPPRLPRAARPRRVASWRDAALGRFPKSASSTTQYESTFFVPHGGAERHFRSTRHARPAANSCPGLKRAQVERPFIAEPVRVLGVVLQLVSAEAVDENIEAAAMGVQPGHDAVELRRREC